MLRPLLGTTDTTAIPDIMADGEDITEEDGEDTTDMDTHTDTGGNVMLNQTNIPFKNVKPKKLKPNQLCCMLDTTDTTLPPFTTGLPGIHMPTMVEPYILSNEMLKLTLKPIP